MPFITGPDVKGRFSFKDGIRQEDPNVSTMIYYYAI